MDFAVRQDRGAAVRQSAQGDGNVSQAGEGAGKGRFRLALLALVLMGCRCSSSVNYHFVKGHEPCAKKKTEKTNIIGPVAGRNLTIVARIMIII